MSIVTAKDIARLTSELARYQARVRELEQALEIACASGKFANPKAAAARILAHVTDKAVKP